MGVISLTVCGFLLGKAFRDMSIVMKKEKTDENTVEKTVRATEGTGEEKEVVDLMTFAFAYLGFTAGLFI